MTQTVTPFLWFNDQAEEAMQFYTSVFADAEILRVNRVGGRVLGGTFRIGQREFHTLNGGPAYRFTPAISLYVNCQSQEEVDELWEKLIADGGAPNRCGWLTDRFGLSWQIIPDRLMALMGDPDPEKANRVFQAMMGMEKINIQTLNDAASAG